VQSLSQLFFRGFSAPGPRGQFPLSTVEGTLNGVSPAHNLIKEFQQSAPDNSATDLPRLSIPIRDIASNWRAKDLQEPIRRDSRFIVVVHSRALTG
jgi:hypothetical protein